MTTDTLSLTGAFTALITPFRDGGVDRDAYAEHVERQIDGGIDGLVPCGTTGEAATMSTDEQIETISICAEVADGRVPVVAGTGSNDTEKTVEMTRRVAEIDGVDAALVVTPYYNKPSQEGMYRHFRRVADRGDLPVVLYNVPSRTGVSLDAETVARLARHDRIVGIKEATGDMRLGSRIHEEAGDDIALMSGDDFTTLPLLSVGGQGCVSVVSNLDPQIMSNLVDLANRGKMDGARQRHQKMLPLARLLFAKPNPVPTKTAAWLMGWCQPDVRAPLYTPSQDYSELMRDMLEDYGLL